MCTSSPLRPLQLFWCLRLICYLTLVLCANFINYDKATTKNKPRQKKCDSSLSPHFLKQHIYHFCSLFEHENFSGSDTRFMLVRKRLRAILLLVPAEFKALCIDHGTVFDVEVLPHDYNGVFSNLSAFFYQKLSTLLSLWEYSWKLVIPLEMCPKIWCHINVGTKIVYIWVKPNLHCSL